MARTGTQPGERRRSSCLVLILIPLWPLWLLWPVVRSARSRATEVFDRPVPGQVTDPLVDSVQRARTVLGLLITVLLLLRYGDGSFGDVLRELVDGGVKELLYVPVLMLVTGAVVVGLFFRFATAAERARMRSGLRHPVRVGGVYLGTLILTVLSITVMEREDWRYLPFPEFAGALVQLGVYLLVVWALPFLLFGSYFVVRSGFGTAAVHPALPAVLTALLVWELTLIGLAVDGPPGGPVEVRLALLLGGPVSVTLLSWWEVARRRARGGSATG